MLATHIRTWEAQRINQTRQKKTNPHTNQVFYTSWSTTSTQNSCPNFTLCPTTKNQYDNWDPWFQYNHDYQTNWANCNDAP